MATKGFFCAVLSLVIVAFGCEKTPEPEGSPSAVSEPAPRPAEQPSSGPAKPGTDLGIAWQEPESWERLPKETAMRKATYRVPRAAGDPEDAELALFYFGPDQGGGVEANMKRWAGQFSDVGDKDIRRSERTANGLTQYLMEIESGTFSGGMPGAGHAKKEKYGLLAAIVETPTGQYFFKLTGPAKTVASARPTFLQLLDGVKVAGS